MNINRKEKYSFESFVLILTFGPFCSTEVRNKNSQRSKAECSLKIKTNSLKKRLPNHREKNFN